MSNPIKLAIDRQAQQLITSLTAFAQKLPTMYQNDVIDVVIQVYDANTIVDMIGYSMRISIGTPATGTVASTLYTPIATLIYDSANQWFTGALDCSQSYFSSTLGNVASTSAILDVNVRLAGVPRHILETAITVSAVVDPGTGGSSPITPTTQYTKAEIDAAFVKSGPQVSKTIYFNTPDGTATWALTFDNNGLSAQSIQPALPTI